MQSFFTDTSRTRWMAVATFLATLVLVIVILYFGRIILIPIALAILLTFILSPIVTRLQRIGLGPKLAVAITMVLTMTLLGSTGAMIVVELRSLAEELPLYRENVIKKISDIRVASKGGALEKIQKSFQEIMDELKGNETTPTNSSNSAVVITEGKSVVRGLPIIGSLLDLLTTAGLVTILVVFMLLRREDLRDRLLHLAGRERLVSTTKAVDEAGATVSRYLLRQCVINICYGIAVMIGLILIGLPYAILWGFLAAITRFIPYVGPWIGALLPISLSLAVFDGWREPLEIAGLILILEVTNNAFLEPTIYGRSIGVSEVALLIMLAFWTWLWGPIGLVLATPLTVCITSVSKTIPGLGFIALLLGRRPALEIHDAFYQRLVARNESEAIRLVDEFISQHSLAESFDQLFVPALISCRNDFRHKRLTLEEITSIFAMVRRLIEEVDHQPDPEITTSTSTPSATRPGIIACPVRDEADELALLMLARLIDPMQWDMRVLSFEMLTAECIAQIEKSHISVLCVGYLADDAPFPLQQYCKKLRGEFPRLPIVLGRWGIAVDQETALQLTEVVNSVCPNLAGTKNEVLHLAASAARVTNATQRTLQPGYST